MIFKSLLVVINLILEYKFSDSLGDACHLVGSNLLFYSCKICVFHQILDKGTSSLPDVSRIYNLHSSVSHFVKWAFSCYALLICGKYVVGRTNSTRSIYV